MKKDSRFEYVGKLENYQLYGNKKYMQYEQDSYSPYQNYLYKRALYGLNAISKEELATMCSKKKQRVTDPNFRNVLTFKDLNISKDQIISIFIEEGVLPKNFMSLTMDPNQLPRLKK